MRRLVLSLDLFVLLLPVLLSGTSVAQTATQAATQAPAQTATAAPFNKAKLDSLFTALDANRKLMGSLVLSQNGQVMYSRAIGQEQLLQKARGIV